MDYWGSGPDWPILYGWPFSKTKIINSHAWRLFSWQNILAFALLLTWTFAIALRLERTPLEAVMPALDAKIVRRLRGILGLPVPPVERVQGFEVVMEQKSGYNEAHESAGTK